MSQWFNTRNISEVIITGMLRFFVLPIFFEAKLDFHVSRNLYVTRSFQGVMDR